MLPAGQSRYGVALHQRSNVAPHALGPGAAVLIQLGGVGDGVTACAQAGSYAVEGGEVQPWQAAHWAAEVNTYHGESLPGHAQVVVLR